MSELPTAAAADAAGAPGPGARLQAAREQRGFGLDDVAESLHVMAPTIAAMEENKFDGFGAPVYARGFLRKYANFLGIDADAVIAAYDRLGSAPGAPSLIPATTARPMRRDYSGLRLPALFAAAVLLLAASFWWWLGRGPAPAATVSPTPLAAPAPAGGPPPTAAADLPPTAPAAGRTPVAASLPAAVVPQRLESTRAAAPAAGNALVIRGRSDCWVEVYASSGGRLLYDLVQAGETRNVPGPGPWRVFLGFVDGVELVVGGRGVSVPVSHRSATTARFVVAADGAVQ